jgi:hypothetical protein
VLFQLDGSFWEQSELLQVADMGRKADGQKRRPERPPELNGGALHLGRQAAHTATPDQGYRNTPSVTEFTKLMQQRHSAAVVRTGHARLIA